MKSFLIYTVLLLAPLLVAAEVYFKETFDDDSWRSKWVQSTYRKDYGAFNVSAGKWYSDEQRGRALQTTEDNRFYAISAPFDKTYSNRDKPLIIQYSVKYESGARCAGGYVKILPPGVDVEKFHGETDYNIMFGPDICGSTTRKVHVIMNYKGKNEMINVDIYPHDDQMTHVYTLLIFPNQTFTVWLDQEEELTGDLMDFFDFLPPKKILDPKVIMPADWDERETIPDPEDKKPADWDDEPEEIPDPDDATPDWWDEDEYGEYYQATIPNPNFKGDWEPRQIPNPKYNGTWVHPEIDNPAYYTNSSIYQYTSGHVALELWQVSAGVYFDNFLITDSVEEAREHAKDIVGKDKDLEYKSKADWDVEDGKRIEREKVEAEKREKEETERKRLAKLERAKKLLEEKEKNKKHDEL
ncbi:calreticulin [Phlyctochytrium arcticum]|nr:calreticulin [Phlyctochytrium arcticum]